MIRDDDQAEEMIPATLLEGQSELRVLRAVFSLCLVAFALMHFFLSPLPYAVLGWFLEGSEASHRVHETCFGFLFVLSLAGLLVQLRRPEAKLAAMYQVALPIWLIMLSMLLVNEALPPVVIVFLAFPILLLVLHPGRRRLLRPPMAWSRVLVALTIVAAVPLVAFAMVEFSTGQEASAVAREIIENAPGDASIAEVERALIDAAPSKEAAEAALHYGHWSAMAAYALSIIVLAVVAASRAPGWRLPAWGAGAAATVYGVASLAAAGEASAAHPVWAMLSIVWGIGFIVMAERERTKQLDAVPFEKAAAI